MTNTGNVIPSPADPSPESEEFKELLRLQDLESYRVMGSHQEPVFDDLLEIIRIRFDTPIAMISFVGKDEVFFKAFTGVDFNKIPRNVSFCEATIKSTEPIVVYDAARDERYKDNPFVTGRPFVQFYAGAPLISSCGSAIGAVCALDTLTRSPGKSDFEFLKGVARLTMNALEMRRQSVELLELANQFGAISERVDWVREELDEQCARNLARYMRSNSA